jgi:hypothetical protein
MNYICIGKCSSKVDSIEKIPFICACGSIGRDSYYPEDYIVNRAKFEAIKNNISISEGYFETIKKLRKQHEQQ